MLLISKNLKKFDDYQYRHKYIGFLLAVYKKYNQDNGGYQAAIITYYGLLSLFPIMEVFTTISQLLLRGNPTLRAKFANSLIRYFPIVGNQLQKAVQSPKRTGLELFISLIITFYGARGIAGALRHTFNNIWSNSKSSASNYIKSQSRNYGIVVCGGLGFIATGVLSSYTAILGNYLIVKILATLLSMAIIWLTLIVIYRLALTGNKSVKEVRIAAAVAAIGIQLLQSIGTAILAHELKELKSEYGTFALVIGLLFWIYLQAEVLLYALEINVVKINHLYPRSLIRSD